MDPSTFKIQVKKELIEILDFWITYSYDHNNGGFIGELSNYNVINSNADKGAILNFRILYALSTAYNYLNDKRYLEAADSAFEYINYYFVDRKYGGVFWLLDSKGNVLDAKKQIYAQAFAIYSLAEYYIATKDKTVLNLAIEIFRHIEKNSFDIINNGYFEAYSRDWKLLDDLRLSEKDINAAKTLNTHLHLMESYTKLFEVWKDEKLEQQLTNLVNLHFNNFYNYKDSSFHLFFDSDWNLKSDIISFGHDIETSWLLQQAAEILKSEEYIKKAQELSMDISNSTLEKGLIGGNSLANEGTIQCITDDSRVWWVQAEAMVGLVNAWQNSGIKAYLNVAMKIWEFIIKYIKSPSGEWYWAVDKNQNHLQDKEKIGMWKCPYHNTRACIEILKRIE